MPKGTRSRLRPHPSHLRISRGQYKEYARFYGTYRSTTGKTKRFSYAVRVNPRLSRAVKYRLMVVMVNALLNKNVPQHRQGQVFPNFHELLLYTPWFRVRKLLQYKAGMHYVR